MKSIPRSLRHYFVRALLLVLLVVITLPKQTVAQIIDVTAQQFHEMATSGELDLIIDVRTMSEWNTGHVENATLMENLSQQLDLTPISDINRTLDSLGIRQCLSCRTLVYCRSGARASRALSLLRNKAGFQGPLYNGQGTGQWTAAGFELVDTPSFMAPCMELTEDELPVCARQGIDDPTTEEPTTTTSEQPTPAPPTPAPIILLPQQKQAPLEAKCGSLANDRGVGGAAAQAKGCSRGSGGGMRRRRLRGL